ncbi:MAG: PD40 domain-containing protein [Anaerolineales bacterium]|nr:PD40 domain-containing protein [Anaerolineales bacterium]
MRKAFQIIGLGMGFLFLSLGGVNATAQPPADDYWVYFSSQGADGDLTTTHLYRMRPDGSDLESLTNDGDTPQNVEYLFWSPDNDWIYFVNHSDNYLYGIRYNGEELTPIMIRNHLDRYVWSPDGEWLIVEAETGIYRMRADGTQNFHISNDFPNAKFRAWLPNSQQIILSETQSNLDTRNDYVVNLDGSGVWPLEINGQQALFGTWSLDGKWLYYTRPMQSALFRSRMDGQESQLIYQGADGLAVSAWSPDGKWLLLSSPHSSNSSLLTVVSPDGAVNINVGISAWATTFFSPDSQWLFYASSAGYRYGIQLNTINPDPVLWPSQIFSWYGWTPDGSRLIGESANLSTHLVLIKPDGSDLELIPLDSEIGAMRSSPIIEFLGDSPIMWSPDDIWLYFSAGLDNFDVYRLNLEGDIERLTDFEGTDVYVGVHE